MADTEPAVGAAALLLPAKDPAAAAPHSVVVTHSQEWWAAQRNPANLPPWTCFDMPGDPKNPLVTMVSCQGPHDRKLFAQAPLDGGWPGLNESQSRSQSACIRAKFADFTDPWALQGEGVSLYYSYPLEQEWTSSRPQALCMLVGPDAQSRTLAEDLRQPAGRYSHEQRALLDLGRTTALLREEILSLPATDWATEKPLAAQLAGADRAEARALVAFASTLGSDLARREARILAANDTEQAHEADALAKASSQAAWTAGVDSGVYTYAGSVEFGLMRDGLGLKYRSNQV